METRELLAADRDDAVALWHATELTRSWNDPALDFDRALAGPTSTVLGRFEDGRLVATVMTGHDGHRGWVYYLAVHPSQQGQGLGSSMMSAAESWLVERSVTKLNLMVRHTNTDAVAFYRRLGYDASDVTVMQRSLM